MLSHLSKYNIVLGSGSPRRQQLLKGLELNFSILKPDTDEEFPENLIAAEVPIYLSQQKAEHLKKQLRENDLLITCDTIVWINNSVLNKPQNFEEAVGMLRLLSGSMHEVHTGVSITQGENQISFSELTRVHFQEIQMEEIEHYIKNYSPFDKAGSYGAQEWLGYTMIRKIEGCYFNVMGLPLYRLYNELKKWK